MKLFYLIEILFFNVLMTFSPAHLDAQDRRFLTRAQMDSILNPTLLKGADKLVHFNEKIVNIGKLTEDDKPVDVVFSFQNISNKPLFVQRITTDCGCTVARADKLSYAPGEKGKVTVTYTPKNHVGTIDASSRVFAPVSEAHPIAKLTILGEVLPGADYWKGYRYVMGTLRLKRNKIQFSFETKGTQTERILCANSGTSELKLTAQGLPSYVEFHTEPAIIKPGEEADLVLKVDASRIPAGDLKRTCSVVVSGLSVPAAERTLKLEIDLSKIK